MKFPLPDLLCKNDQLVIRRFLPADAPLIFAYSQEECTRRELPDEVFDSLEETAEIIDGLNQNSKTGEWPIVYCVALSGNDTPIGHVSLSPIGEEAIEIGYSIGEAWQGKGYGCQATALFTQWALTDGEIKKLYGIVKESNPASIRCLEKAGYRMTAAEERDCFGSRYLIREYVREAE
ncbi:MAG: GNAT family N-acetyltransferase [Clostridia bacterium]|nr:GNAT family N-acetyltransferase [Clostridia bacterium]